MIDYAGIVCTARDAQELGYCVRGQRKLWKNCTDIPFEQFVRTGVSAQTLLDSGNPYAIALVDHVIRKQDVLGKQGSHSRV